MSSPNDLKNILIDAARYRGLRKMVDGGCYWLSRDDFSVATSSKIMDEEIDEIINHE